MAKAQPWDRQEGESEQAFEYFSYWLTHKYVSPPFKTKARNIIPAARDLHVTKDLLQRYSSEWGWTSRALEYDNHLNRIKTKTAEQQVAAMHRRHLKLARLLQATAQTGLEGIDLEGVSPNALVGMAEVGVKVERLTRGEVTDRTGTQDELDLSRLTDEELAILSKLRDKARR